MLCKATFIPHVRLVKSLRLVRMIEALVRVTLPSEKARLFMECKARLVQHAGLVSSRFVFLSHKLIDS